MKIKLIFLAVCFFIVALHAAALLFPRQIYGIYWDWKPWFTNYVFLLMVLLPLAVLVFGVLNFRYLKEIVAKDKYFLAILAVSAVVLTLLILHQPVLVRPDKEIMTVQSALQFGPRFFSDLEGFAFRARGLFFALHYLSFFLPLTVKTLTVINSLLFVFSALAIYLILKLLLDDSGGEREGSLKFLPIAFGGALLYLFHPNNLLLAVSPEYAFPGQVFGLFSLFALFLFLKFGNKIILIWSLSLLILSLLLRIEMVIFPLVYFFILFRYRDKILKFSAQGIIILFLLVVLPLVFQVFLGYVNSSFSGGNYALRPETMEAVKGGENLVAGLLKNYSETLRGHFVFNWNYLLKSVPLVYVLFLLPLFIWRNKKIQDHFCHFAVYFLAISALHYKEYFTSYHYLSYVIPPLVILVALVLKEIYRRVPVNAFSFAAVAVLLVYGALFYHQPFLDDSVVKLWNKEYSYISGHKAAVKNDSAIISNLFILMEGVIDARKNIVVVRAEPDLARQVRYLKNRHRNVYIVQGILDITRQNAPFSPDDWQKIIDEKFHYRTVYRRNLGADMGQNFPVFLYEIEGLK